MSSLAQLQKDFLSCLQAPLNSKDRLQPSRIGGRWIKSEIKPNSRLTAVDRIEIYARQYWFRILESLYDDFPGLRALMGDQEFERLIRRYIEKFPSRSYTLRDFGTRLPPFILKEKRAYKDKSALYYQMATMELAQLHVYDEKEESPLTAKQLGARPLLCRLRISPHVRLMALDYPLDEWQLKLNQGGVREQLSNGVLDRRLKSKCRALVGAIKKERIYLAVHRYQFKVYFKRIEPWAFELLTAFDQGISLGAAIEKVMKQNKFKDAVSAASVQTQFQEWSAMGWISLRKSKK